MKKQKMGIQLNAMKQREYRSIISFKKPKFNDDEK